MVALQLASLLRSLGVGPQLPLSARLCTCITPQYDAEVEAPPPPRSQRAIAAAAAHAEELAGEEEDDGRDRPGAHSERGQRMLKDNTSANAQLFTLQTELFIMKVRRASPQSLQRETRA